MKRAKRGPRMPHLSDHDLRQMDLGWQEHQSEPTVRRLLARALDDLRTARDRLNQRPDNSSRPSGSMPPWQRGRAGDDDGGSEAPAEPEAPPPDESTDPEPPPVANRVATLPDGPPKTTPGRPGRPVGAPGHGREQVLAVTRVEEHRPQECAACGTSLPNAGPAQAWTAWDTAELVPISDATPGVLGLRIEVTRHVVLQQACCCGHITQAHAVRANADPCWPGVALSEQRLLGPRLAATVVYLCLRMRLPQRKVSELLLELFGLQLSPALIAQTVQQTGRSVAPLEDELVQQLEQVALVHADETSWPEAGLALWLWVLCCCHTVLYLIGPRSKEMFDNALNAATFAGTVMSDGYAVYRDRTRRLRCWAHLQRKLVGLAESTDRQGAHAGAAMLDLFKQLMAAVFAARDHPAQPPPAVSHVTVTAQLLALCQRHSHSPHAALRTVAREFLLDWAVIMLPLTDPSLPLTNNFAERQLRHFVIARRISYGTRTPVGSRSVTLLASIIDTCRLRGASVTAFLAEAIHAARRNLPPPHLPPIPADLLTPRAALQ